MCRATEAAPASPESADADADAKTSDGSREQECLRRYAERERAAAAAPVDPKHAALPGEDAAFAAKMGWPVVPDTLAPGALLPCHRVLAYYGNPNSKRMGVLGEYPRDEMLRRLGQAVAEWNTADPEHPVVPALQLIVTVAQAHPGPQKLYRARMPAELIEKVHGWAREANALLILDVQVGRSLVEKELVPLLPYLSQPDVHLALDPEFAMGADGTPGVTIGRLSAADIDGASATLERLVVEHGLPPKLLVVHRFTRRMVQGAKGLTRRPHVQLVMNMDGWGNRGLKRDTFRDVIVREPVEYAGFKIFYGNDQKLPGWTLMKPADVLRLHPTPLYIQYQ